MNSAILVMHALKETCALHCLVALHLAGPHPVTQRTVMTITGFDDGAVHRGLHKLLALGLVTCTGQRHHTAWRLAPAAAQLPLGLAVAPIEDAAAPADPSPPPALPAPGPAPVTTSADSSPPVAPPVLASPQPLDPAARPAAGEFTPAHPPPALAPPHPLGAAALPAAATPAARPLPRRARKRPRPAVDSAPPLQPRTPPAAESTSTPIPQPADFAPRPPFPIPPLAESAPEREKGDLINLKEQATESNRLTPSSNSLSSGSRPPSSGVAGPPAPAADALRASLHAVFHRAGIWPGGRAKLARELAAAGPHWLDQALGWLCYAVRCFPQMATGAVVYPALRDRLALAPDYLPPPGLSFEAALEWAARGGLDEPAYANDDDRPPAAALISDFQPAAAADQPSTADPWAATLARLRAERGGPQLDPWFKGARLQPAGPGAWRLLVATPQARDWISNRLRGRLARLLGEGLGAPVELEIALDEPAPHG
jgi:hypothetical protein